MRALRSLALALALALAALPGCTSVALRNSTLASGRTLTDLQYTMVLDNVALARALPGALPWHLKITQGAVEIIDNPSAFFDVSWSPSAEALGVSHSREIIASWTTVPSVQAPELLRLQEVYARAAGEDWVERGRPGERDAPSGRYRDERAWVRKENVPRLTQLVLEVLTAAKVEQGERGLLLPGPSK